MRSFLHTFDQNIIVFLQRWLWLRGFMLAITHFGHPIVVIGIAVIIGVMGIVLASLSVVILAIVVGLTLGIGSVLKKLLHRDRPLTDYVAHMTTTSLSFPSGHATGATAAYGCIAYLAWEYLSQPWGILVVGICVGMILAIGVSRVYLGAHFPSDVVGGWLLGSLGLLSIICIIRP